MYGLKTIHVLMVFVPPPFRNFCKCEIFSLFTALYFVRAASYRMFGDTVLVYCFREHNKISNIERCFLGCIVFKFKCDPLKYTLVGNFFGFGLRNLSNIVKISRPLRYIFFYEFKTKDYIFRTYWLIIMKACIIANPKRYFMIFVFCTFCNTGVSYTFFLVRRCK